MSYDIPIAVKIKDSPICSYKIGEQTIDHIIFDCELVEKERDRLNAAVLRSENWPVNKHTLINKYSKEFKKLTDSLSFYKL
jgi:hypothetical protein